MRRALLLLLALTGCATRAAPAAVCLPLKPYTPAEQTEAARELAVAQQFPEITAMLGDYIIMRDADRACLKTAP
jgi:hypothetical protein